MKLYDSGVYLLNGTELIAADADAAETKPRKSADTGKKAQKGEPAAPAADPAADASAPVHKA